MPAPGLGDKLAAIDAKSNAEVDARILRLQRYLAERGMFSTANANTDAWLRSSMDNQQARDDSAAVKAEFTQPESLPYRNCVTSQCMYSKCDLAPCDQFRTTASHHLIV